MGIIIGSAKIDENRKAMGGAVGDQKQKTSNDTAGEVSMQSFYVHPKGWYILRAKNTAHAKKMANLMKTACNNPNLGYDQSNRLGVITHGVESTVKTECDCSSLVREIIKEATGVDVGNFTTATQVATFKKSGLFEEKITYVSQAKTPVYDGDILVTKTQGHTVIVVSGNPRNSSDNSSDTIDKSSDNKSKTEYEVGDVVNFTGCLHYTSSQKSGVAKGCKAGVAKVTNTAKGNAHPYHLIAVSGKGSTVYGWVNASDIAGKATGTKTHKVVKGEDLSKIAKKYNTTVDALVKLNGIKNKNLIYVGQIIKLP